MEDVDRVRFCCEQQLEVAKLAEFFPFFSQQREYVFELAYFICAVHLSVQETQPVDKQSVLLDAILEVSNYRIVCDNLATLANPRNNELFLFLRNTLDCYRTQQELFHDNKNTLNN